MTSRPPPSSMADEQAVLQARARALARPPAADDAAGPTVDVLAFRLATESYALLSTGVDEVCPLKDLAPLPCTPAFVRGVVNLRGRILAVLDIKRLLGLPEQGLTDLHHIIVVTGHGLALGLLADSIVGVCSLPLSSLQPPLPASAGAACEYLLGITAERLLVLDIDRMLTDPRILVDEQVGEA